MCPFGRSFDGCEGSKMNSYIRRNKAMDVVIYILQTKYKACQFFSDEAQASWSTKIASSSNLRETMLFVLDVFWCHR